MDFFLKHFRRDATRPSSLIQLVYRARPKVGHKIYPRFEEYIFKIEILNFFLFFYRERFPDRSCRHVRKFFQTESYHVNRGLLLKRDGIRDTNHQNSKFIISIRI